MRRTRPPAHLARLAVVLAAAVAMPAIAPVVSPSARTEAAAAVTTPYASSGSRPIAPSTVHDWGTAATGTGPQAVHFVEVDPADPSIVLEARLSNDRVRGLETTTSQASRASYEGHRAIAAINGDIWSGYTSETLHAPHGLHVQGGELVTAGPVAYPYPTIGFRADDSALTGSPVVSATLTTAAAVSVAMTRINQSRRAGEVVLYSPRFGSSTGTDAAGTEVVLGGAALPLTATGSWTATVASVRPNLGNTSIPAGSLVVSASSSSAAAATLAALVPGEQVTIGTSVTAGWESIGHAISGREWIVRDGAVSIFPQPDSAAQAHPRSAVGIRADGRLILATVDGRQPGYSVGVTLPELAQLMIERGAVSAINLDGGGSTTLAVRQPGDLGISIANRPSDGRERSVTNALVVYSTAPTGPLASLTVSPGDRDVYLGSSVTYAAKGVDAALNPVPVSGGSVGWSLEGEVGTLDAAGRFRATALGTGRVNATAAGVTAEAEVTVVPDTVPPEATAPVARFVNGTVARTSASMTVAWGATDVGLGVASYELRKSVDGAPWVDVPLPTATTRSLRMSLPLGHRYRFQVRATDKAGNVGAWASGSAFRLRMLQERAARYSSRWTATTWSGYVDGRGRYARARGAVARYTFTGSQVAWIGPKAPTRGSARVYVDGAYVKTVSLYARSTATARVLYSRAWSSTGRHTLEIRVVGTSGRPRIDIDAFLLVDPPEPDPVLVGAGDIASCVMSGDSATAKLLDGIAGTVFTAGDNAYEHGTAAQFNDCYRPTWGRHRSRTRPAPGNHDYFTAGAAGYFGYFGTRAGTAGQGWYAYDVGAWRVYALNSNCAAIGGCEAGSAQETWLRTDLAANPRQCVLAYWHHPVFSSGVHGNDPTMGDIWAALHEAGAEVVVNGHDHDYERFAPQAPDGSADPAGIREFVVGTGGAGLRGFGTVRANSLVRSSSAHGVLKLTLRPTSYSWAFVPVAGKTFKDSGSTACH